MLLRAIAFYKPYNVLSTFTDAAGRDTLSRYIDLPGVYAAGRLDFDSEGLLLLTNAGRLSHQLTEPGKHLPKTYLVQVEGVVTPIALAHLSNGVVIKGKTTRRCEALAVAAPDVAERQPPVTPHGATAWLRIVLTEGRKRQIRHMCAAVGLPALRLLRIAIGPVTLEGLKPGEWRELRAIELEKLNVLGLTQDTTERQGT